LLGESPVASLVEQGDIVCRGTAEAALVQSDVLLDVRLDLVRAAC
jgi:hypothetical protein